MSLLLLYNQAGGAPEAHTGTVVLTGGGSVTLVGAKGALAAVTLTGGGSVTLAQATARASAIALTGGGALVLVGTSARFGTVVITGGGSVTVSGGIAMGVIAGLTRDADGDPIGFCTVDAFESATNTLYGTTTSNAAGRYAIVVVPGVAYFLVAYSATDVYGVTARDIVGA